MTAPSRSIAFERACDLLERLLEVSVRRDVVAGALESATLGESLRRLRERMSGHAWAAGGAKIELAPLVDELDRRTRDEGFHALHDWDAVRDRVNEDSIPVGVLNAVVRDRGSEPVDAAVVAILFDYYVLHLLGLLALRIWDRGDPDDNLDRLDALLGQLQGAESSGHRFADDAATLLLIATTHDQPRASGYAILLERVRTLHAAHQRHVALGHAVGLGCHLRFRLEATYARDVDAMRDDNLADYSWLSFSLTTILREYDRAAGERRAAAEDGARLAEALLNGLSPDPRAFLTPVAPDLPRDDRSELRELFALHRDALAAAFEAHKPSARGYSPLSLFFNLSHDVLKGAVVDAVHSGKPWAVSLNDLFSSHGATPDQLAARKTLATALMGYARANPHRIRGRLVPVIVYDPQAGRRAFAAAMREVRSVPP
jgi:hypothetical protein